MIVPYSVYLTVLFFGFQKAYQTCEYDGFIPKSRLRVGQVVKDAWGKTCRCMPGYVDGIVHCGDDECGTFDPEENTCKSHGDGVMYDDDHVKDEDIGGNHYIYIDKKMFKRIIFTSSICPAITI